MWKLKHHNVLMAAKMKTNICHETKGLNYIQIHNKENFVNGTSQYAILAQVINNLASAKWSTFLLEIVLVNCAETPKSATCDKVNYSM